MENQLGLNKQTRLCDSIIDICNILFQWKKIGFWFYIITDLAVVVLNIYQGKGISQLWSALFGIALLFGVMQITTKSKNTTWEDLD